MPRRPRPQPAWQNQRKIGHGGQWSSPVSHRHKRGGTWCRRAAPHSTTRLPTETVHLPLLSICSSIRPPHPRPSIQFHLPPVHIHHPPVNPSIDPSALPSIRSLPSSVRPSTGPSVHPSGRSIRTRPLPQRVGRNGTVHGDVGNNLLPWKNSYVRVHRIACASVE